MCYSRTGSLSVFRHEELESAMDDLRSCVNLDSLLNQNRGRTWPPAPARPVHVSGFLERAFADRLAVELLSRDDWSQSRYLVFPEEGTVRSVTDDEYRALPDGQQVRRHGSLSTIGAKTLRESAPLYRRLRRELLKPELLKALGKMMGMPVTPATDVNASTFRDGDFLAPHQDTFEGWVSSFVIYLTDTADCVGGELEFDNGAEQYRVSVQAGDAVFIPINQRFSHQVLRVDRGARLSLNFHLKAVSA